MLDFLKINCYSCHILMKLEISKQILEKTYSNIKFNECPSRGSRVLPCKRKDIRTYRHEEANSRFRNVAKAPQNYI